MGAVDGLGSGTAQYILAFFFIAGCIALWNGWIVLGKTHDKLQEEYDKIYDKQEKSNTATQDLTQALRDLSNKHDTFATVLKDISANQAAFAQTMKELSIRVDTIATMREPRQ